jgi:actin related protein 2/3 complex subunit 5
MDLAHNYSYKGMSQVPSGSKNITPQATGFSQIQGRQLGHGDGGHSMSVLLSWHEKVVEVAGLGCIMRVMTDRRTV